MTEDNINILKEVKCTVGTISLRTDKILTFVPFEGVTTCTLENLKEQFDIYMELTNGVPHLFYTDNTNVRSFGSEERAFVSEKFHLFASASAIKEDSSIVRFITHSMIYLNKPQIPLKMFKTKNEAIHWLKSLN